MNSRFKRKRETSRFTRIPKLTLVPEIEKTPKQTKRNKPRPIIKIVHALPNEIAVPTPFEVYSRNQKFVELGYHKTPLVIQYGETEIQVSGQKLNTKDEDIFIILTQLAVEHGNKLDFITSMAELCRRFNGQYTKECKKSIEKSLERLCDAKIQMTYFADLKQDKIIGKGFNRMLSQHTRKIDEETKEIHVTLDPYFNQLFRNKLMTTIIPQFRLGLKRDVAKQLYIYFQRQVSANKTVDLFKTRPIYLRTLCNLIGVDRDRKQEIFSLRVLIKRGLEELKSQGYFKTYSMKNDLVKVVVKSMEHRRLQKSLQGSNKYRYASKEIEHKTEPESKSVEKKEPEKYQSLLKRFEEKTGIEISEGKDQKKSKENAIKIIAIGKIANLKYNLLDEFAKWISGQDWVDSISSGTLDYTNKIFSSDFRKSISLEIPSDNAINKQYKLLTESDIEKEQRQKKEKEVEIEREREEQKQKRKRAEEAKDRSWGYDCIKETFKDLREDNKLDVGDIIDELKNKYGKDNWKEQFKKFVKEVEIDHQLAEDLPDATIFLKRRYSYSTLFKIGSFIWNEVFPQK